jgi:hypothetical protein
MCVPLDAPYLLTSSYSARLLDAGLPFLLCSLIASAPHAAAATGNDADRASPSSASSEQNGARGEGETAPQAEGPSSPWPAQLRMLQLSATFSKTDSHYLMMKDRSKWWKRAKFPQVRCDGLGCPQSLA